MKNWLAPKLIRAMGYLPLPVSRALGNLVGWLAWCAGGRSARVTQVNLALCFPELDEEQRRALARASLRETAKTAAEAAVVWQRSPEWLVRHTLAIDGLEQVEAAQAEGRGVLIIAPHLGNWEVIPGLLARYGTFTAMYQPPKIPGMDKLILKGRSKAGIQMAPTNRRGVSQLLKALKKGELVGILPDQIPESDSGAEVAPFFGQPALTMTLVHNLVARAGAVPLMVFAERIPKGFKLVIRPCQPGVGGDDVQASVAALNASVEACVRTIPAQYQWEYKRFHRLPEGYPRFYDR
ncbi:lysophospholipid acyltransferase family protein [Marinimicrobium alkaliphilum]|uniref:lysophospholipid acyltransferase family protein n=1 Tax=Marinimicrobium alkaliphilum TaxID=2202654 RepID=UPI000DB91534|nr:lysophospholipid acyltransferase family protein [Marinimicrobium alkaliphilum]